MRRIALAGCLTVLLMLCLSLCSAAVIWDEDFESGWGAWTADNGVWQVGQPCATPGPGGPHGGLNCAGTVLCGNYPAGTNSRLISPGITVPTVSAGQELWLRFWQWFSYADDQGYVQISVRQPDGTTWSSWATLSSRPNISSTWSLCGIELTAYAGKTVKIAYYHMADANYGHVEGPGWYIDDVTIERYVPALPSPEGFESGWGGWSTDNGVWQIGAPTSGPGAAHTGSSCAATRLDGNYPGGTASRLTSPTTALPTVSAGQELWLRFWEWFSYADDHGQVQISVRQPDGSWAAWVTLTSLPNTYSAGWSLCGIELSAYAGKTVRIGLYHSADANYGHVEAPGWYVDDMTIEKYVPSLPSPEGFESGWGGWSTDNGVWQIGAPTSGPGAAHTGSSCAATILNGNYPGGTASRLISPTVQLPSVATGEELWISFWQWFSYADDHGHVQIYVQQPNGTWSGPTDLATVSGISGGWSRSTLEVTANAGKTIRFAFYHSSDTNYGHIEAPGWYIDDFQLYVPLANTITLAKQRPDGDRAAIPGMVVSGVWSSYFHIQDDSHHPSCGLRVQWSGGGVNVGDRVNVAGPMGTRSEGERYMGATSAAVVGSVPEVIPVGVTCRSVGGGDYYYNPLTGAGQMGVAAGMGLNNVGLLIRSWGKVTEIGSGFFYMDDGWAMESMSRRVKVLGDVPEGTLVGDAVQVTGASSCDSILFDHFTAAPLNTLLWTAVKGTPTFVGSYLTLTSTGAGTGKDVRSKDLFEGISMEVKAKSTNWKVDTSFGFEFWDAGTHYGVVVTNGCLGIINKSKPAPNEVYIAIPDWASLKALDLIYTLRWKSDKVVLDIKDHPLSTVSYDGDLIPARPLAIRFNASNDLADQLSIDYVKVVPQRLIRPRDEADIVAIP